MKVNIFSIISTLFRRIKTDIPLIFTCGLLFYYLFKNELDMLNTFAENELLPHITNDLSVDIPFVDTESGLSDKHQTSSKIDTNDRLKGEDDLTKSPSVDVVEEKSDFHTPDLLNYEVLLEKNRFFPILQNDLNINDAFNSLSITPSKKIASFKDLSRRLKNLLVDHFTWKNTYNYIEQDYPNIQAKKFLDNGFAINKKQNEVKDIFVETFNLYSKILNSEIIDEVKPISKTKNNNGNGFGRSLLGSLDMFYLLNMEEELELLMSNLADHKNLETAKNLLNTNENFITIVSSLISGYELSNEKDEIWLNLAKSAAKIALKAYDTPINGLPTSELPSKSLIQNRFPFRKTSIFDISGNLLEFIKLSSITRENVYISTGMNVFNKMYESAVGVFNLDYLFPTVVDPSGCQIIKRSQDHKLVPNSEGFMKSIFNGNYLNCLQRNTIISVNDEYNFDYDINNLKDEFIDLINDDGNVNYLFSFLKSYHLINAHADFILLKEYFEKAFELINKFMLYKPLLPTTMKEKFSDLEYVLFTPIFINKGGLHTEKHVQEILIKQSLTFKSQHCQLGGMFLYASNLLKNATYKEVGEQLINGCTILPELVGLDTIPESVTFDKCLQLDNCYTFDSEEKLNSLRDGSAFKDNYFNVEEKGFFTNSEKITIHKDIFKRDTFEEVNEDEKVVDEKSDMLSQIYRKQEESKNLIPYKKMYRMTTSKAALQNKQFISEKQAWLNEVYPLHINNMDTQYLMRPEFIESLFYAYRITGDSKYRNIASDSFDKMIRHVKHVHNKHVEISAIEDLYTDKELDILPYYWFTRTLKYYYLIFSDVSTYSLDDYVFNGDGHIFKKNYEILAK